MLTTFKLSGVFLCKHVAPVIPPLLRGFSTLHVQVNRALFLSPPAGCFIVAEFPSIVNVNAAEFIEQHLNSKRRLNHTHSGQSVQNIVPENNMPVIFREAFRVHIEDTFTVSPEVLIGRQFRGGQTAPHEGLLTLRDAGVFHVHDAVTPLAENVQRVNRLLEGAVSRGNSEPQNVGHVGGGEGGVELDSPCISLEHEQSIRDRLAGMVRVQ